MKSIIDLFETSVQQFNERVFLIEKQEGSYQGTSYKNVHEEVMKLAAGLLSAGIHKGDRIGLLSEGRNQWLISELGILYAGATNVPLSVKLDPRSELLFRLQHSGCRMIFVSGDQLPKIEQIRHQLPELEKIICLDEKDNREDLLSYGFLLETGQQFLQQHREEVIQRYRSVQPDDVANISYTSGTTADPKGIMLSHLNYTINVIQSNTLMKIDPDWRTLAFLPWDHAFAHTACLYCLMYNGAGVAALENGETPFETLKNIPKNIREVRPHILMSVPAVAKNFRKGIESAIRQQGSRTEKLFKIALQTAYRYNGNGFNRGNGFRCVYRPLNALFDRILFSKIRQNFGGNLRLFIGGGALLDIDLQRFFYAIGLPMCQGYGLSEASPVISSNTPDAIKFGSSGKPVKYLKIIIVNEKGQKKPIGEKGEIIVRGENVMKGYWKNEEATRETIINGWLHTGDLGYLDSDGFLFVLGRFKSLLIGNDGEKFSPEGIEEALVENSSFIDQCMLINNQNSYTGGLLVPNKANLRQAVLARKLNPESREGIKYGLCLIQQEVDNYKGTGKFSKLFPERWLPASVVLLSEAFTEENHLLNSTLKKVRGKINDHFSKEIDFLFTAEARKIGNTVNCENLRKWFDAHP